MTSVLYAGYLQAFRGEQDGLHAYSLPVTVLATNEREARGLAWERACERFPINQGYFDVGLAVMQVPDEMLSSAFAIMLKRGQVRMSEDTSDDSGHQNQAS